jgi:hypothetical protein
MIIGWLTRSIDFVGVENGEKQRNQRADADRVVNVLGEFVAKFGANFVIALLQS